MIEDLNKKLNEDLEGAVKYPGGIHSMSSLRNNVIELKRHPERNIGQSLLWKNVKFTLKNEINVITGIPGSGKSVWLDNIIINSINRHKKKWAIFSPEHLPVENHIKQLIEIGSKSNFTGEWGATPTTEERINEFITQLNRHIFFLNPQNDNDLKIENLLGLIQFLHDNYQVDSFALDPYNEFAYTRPRDISETEYVSLFLGRIRKFIAKNHMMAWIVAHPTKMRKGDDGKYPIPTAYDISGSANFYNKPDNIISVHRDKSRESNPENKVQIAIQKIKNRTTGEIGIYELKFNYKDGTYSDVPVYGKEYDPKPKKKRKDIYG